MLCRARGLPGARSLRAPYCIQYCTTLLYSSFVVMAAGLPTSFAAFHAESETLLTDLRSIMAVSSQVCGV